MGHSTHKMNADVIIIGGGLVGLTFACAVAKLTPLSILILEASDKVIDPVAIDSPYRHRVSAIALASQRIFKTLGIWETIQQRRVSPFTGIEVWESWRQSQIHFDSREIAQPQLGYIIENDVIQSALEEKIKTFPQIAYLSSVKLEALKQTENAMECVSSAGESYTAKLVIGADGAHSWLRQQAGMAVDSMDYHQTAIVANVRTEKTHDKIARQVFLPSGPLAFLPLAEPHLSSIVWSLPEDDAQDKLEQNEIIFNEMLATAFSHRLGQVLETSKRFAFSLHKQQAKNYIQHRIALLGDAAHVIHPLAGQGVNIGLLDAASLAQVVTEAVHQRRDFASFNVLRRYERWRKADNQALLLGVDWIKKLFANEKPSAQHLRAAGLNLTNIMAPLKNSIMRHAVGDRGGLPPWLA